MTGIQERATLIANMSREFDLEKQRVTCSRSTYINGELHARSMTPLNDDELALIANAGPRDAGSAAAVAAPAPDRPAVIASATKEWDGLDPHQQRHRSRASFVNGQLIVSGYQKLSSSEFTAVDKVVR